MESQLREGERIVKKGFANLQKNIEAVGGRLYLTNRRLIFESHWLNIQSGVTEVELCDIESSANCWTRSFDLIPVLPTSCRVRTRYGEEYRFIVFRRDSWTRAIRLQSSKQFARAGDSVDCQEGAKPRACVVGGSTTSSRIYAGMILSLAVMGLGAFLIYSAHRNYRTEVERRQNLAETAIIGFSTDGGAFGRSIDSTGYVQSETLGRSRDRGVRAGSTTMLLGASGFLISLGVSIFRKLRSRGLQVPV